MQLRLNENKTVEVKFGVGFVRELDKNHPLEAKGIKLGMSLSMKIPEILGGDVASLSDVLYAGTLLEKERPTQTEIDNFIDEHEDIEALFDEVIKALEESNAGKRILKQNRENLKKQNEENPQEA
jgi:hypothetical protein|nr:MAG TPA: tail assembly chaperone [Caudoviricetes sp.]DAS08600.1 MAG TPA: tail assembly chaperone [Caudoviricetes sp.]